MPYIKQKDRIYFEKEITEMVESITEPGELCYCIYTILKKLTDKDYRFKNMSSLIGEVEAAKLEYYRRVVSPYEDIKITENGDIE